MVRTPKSLHGKLPERRPERIPNCRKGPKESQDPSRRNCSCADILNIEAPDLVRTHIPDKLCSGVESITRALACKYHPPAPNTRAEPPTRPPNPRGPPAPRYTAPPHPPR